MVTTTLPGFSEPVHEAQRTFKGLLDALSHPGQLYSPTVKIIPPEGLTPICASACLTLLDLETIVWLQPTLPNTVKNWLGFHTGCQFSEWPQDATFAIIGDMSSQSSLPDLKDFNQGSAEDPEHSTTMLIQVQDFTSGIAQRLNGPGILESIEIAPNFPKTFWDQWTRNHHTYPQGVDCFLLSHNTVMGLPRTAKVLATCPQITH